MGSGTTLGSFLQPEAVMASAAMKNTLYAVFLNVDAFIIFQDDTSKEDNGFFIKFSVSAKKLRKKTSDIASSRNIINAGRPRKLLVGF